MLQAFLVRTHFQSKLPFLIISDHWLKIYFLRQILVFTFQTKLFEDQGAAPKV